MSELFAAAVAIEDTDPKAALRLYEQLLADDPGHASANINAGTIYYQQKRLDRAEACYRRAIQTDPAYALAYFDLANVLDDTGHRAGAIDAYLRALAIDPNYADCHYNLAIVYGEMGKRRRQMHHFEEYLRHDQTSVWARHARSVIASTLDQEPLKVVRSNPRPRLTKRRARLVLVK